MSVRVPEVDGGLGLTGDVPATDLVVVGGSPPFDPARISVDTDEVFYLSTTLEIAASLADLVDERVALLVGGVESEAHIHDVQHLYQEVLGRLEEVRHGPAGVRALAANLRELASDLRLQLIVYNGAEQQVTASFDPPWWRTILSLLPPPIGGRLRSLARLEDVGEVALHLWGYAHLLAVQLVPGDVPLVPDAPYGPMTSFLANELGERMQYMNHEIVRGYYIHGGQPIDVTGMTPVQRAALVAFSWLRVPSTLLVGAGGPDVRTNPFIDRAGLQRPGVSGQTGTPQAIPTAIGRAVATPRSPAEALARLEETSNYLRWRHGSGLPGQLHRLTGGGAGAIEILRTTTSDGERHWTVLVPGTQSLAVGNTNPMDMQTNLEVIAGVQSDMEIGVAQAMRQMGIPADEPVSIVGHSQGGMVATAIAADPIMQQQYDISTVLTAGSPVGTIDDIPHETNLMHLEDIQDGIVGLDGESNESAPNRTTVTHLSESATSPGQYHELPPYVDMAERLPESGHPAAERWGAIAEESMGMNDDGASTESFVFELHRQ
ncbi:hypothetical protein [Georgenia alba]|uniref:GPI inositol-deacylase PGAP1-like alpha/beta domain-containing protein n=1 Tax=Georgenia alba TaxID=2233858 RepID=A0ABW2Q2W6_9MICO